MRGEPRERERVIPLLTRILLMLAACNVVRATAVHVVLVRSVYGRVRMLPSRVKM